MSFLISGYARSGTKFLSDLMNKSESWEVKHEPTGEWDYTSGNPNKNMNETAHKRIQDRFQDNHHYGEVNSYLRIWFPYIDVNYRGLVVRNPKELFVSMANRRSNLLLEQISREINYQYRLFVGYKEKFGDSLNIIEFQKMVTDVEYCQSILDYFGIKDVKVTEQIINTKVNPTDDRHRRFWKHSIFENKVIEQIGQACMSFNKLIEPKEIPPIEE